MSGPECPRCMFGEIEDGECTDCGLDAEDVADAMFGGNSLEEFDECPICHEMLGIGEDGEPVCTYCTEGLA